MYILTIILSHLILFSAAKIKSDNKHCDAASATCGNQKKTAGSTQKLLLYDVDLPEGFDERRDIYIRYAVMIKQAQKRGKLKNWKLVLPPWNFLYNRNKFDTREYPWGFFYDMESITSYAPVVEFYEVFPKNAKHLEVDTLYVLRDHQFENGNFSEHWEIDDCRYLGDRYYGYKNITVKQKICVNFQGRVSKLLELISLHPKDKTVMFAHAEIPGHDKPGSMSFWECRFSMRFHTRFLSLARNYIAKHLNCRITLCETYVSVHWRRRVSLSQAREVPSIESSVSQIVEYSNRYAPKAKKVFFSSDCMPGERRELERQLHNFGYQVYFFDPDKKVWEMYRETGMDIVDQIICSHSAYFFGTFKTTFTHRIQEDREIYGFHPVTTFNRLCPDEGFCENPPFMKWVED